MCTDSDSAIDRLPESRTFYLNKDRGTVLKQETKLVLVYEVNKILSNGFVEILLQIILTHCIN